MNSSPVEEKVLAGIPETMLKLKKISAILVMVENAITIFGMINDQAIQQQQSLGNIHLPMFGNAPN